MISIKNIIFDLGNVILKNKSISVLENMNIDTNTYDELKKFFNDWSNLDLGKETILEKYHKCNFPSSYDILYKDILINYYKYRDINTKLIELISKLKNNNYNVYILSDNNIESYNYYKNHELFKNIDGWVISSLYGTCKKDGALFDILLIKYNLNSNECYFIDDNIINIEEAKKHGIKGYLFNEDDIDDLYIDMRKNKINI